MPVDINAILRQQATYNASIASIPARVEIAHQQIPRSNIEHVAFNDTMFYDCSFTEVTFGHCTFKKAQFIQPIFVRTEFVGCDFDDVELNWPLFQGGVSFKYCKNIIVGPARSDGYVFFGTRRDNRLYITAGCRYFLYQKARDHWSKCRLSSHPLTLETLDILEFMRRRAAGLGWNTD